MLRLEAKIQRVEVVRSRPELVAEYAQLRSDREPAGQALAQKSHTADRWIAATTIRLGLPLVSNDGIFRGAPGLELENGPVWLNEPNPGFRMYPFGTRGRVRRSEGALAAKQKGPVLQDLLVMELGGLEPPTSWVRSRRSPN